MPNLRFTPFIFMAMVLLSGCGEESREYQVKQNTGLGMPEESSHQSSAGHAGHVHRPYDFSLPSQWKEKPSSGMRLLSFSDVSGELDGSLVVLGLEAADLESNINRWRGQVGLEEISKEACLKSLDEGTSALGSFKSLKLKGPDGKGILAAIYTLPNKVLFAKMMGPSSKTENEEKNFLTFCSSLKAHTH
jgi:hypothetical protein